MPDRLQARCDGPRGRACAAPRRTRFRGGKKVGGQGGEKLKPGNREAASGFSFQRFSFPLRGRKRERVDPGDCQIVAPASRPAVCQETPTRARRPCHARHTGGTPMPRRSMPHPARTLPPLSWPRSRSVRASRLDLLQTPREDAMPPSCWLHEIPPLHGRYSWYLMAAMIERKADIQAVQTALKRSRGVHGPAVVPLV